MKFTFVMLNAQGLNDTSNCQIEPRETNVFTFLYISKFSIRGNLIYCNLSKEFIKKNYYHVINYNYIHSSQVTGLLDRINY